MKTYFTELNINDNYSFTAIGSVESPFKDKYGVPRQPSLAQNIKGRIVLKKDPDLVTAIKDLNGYSHLWVVFVFHKHGGKNWKPSIRPPRLGGRQKVGILSSRSPHRPNPIGISVVQFHGIDELSDDQVALNISGMDLIDGTPVLDIKPYLPYTDAVPHAEVGWSKNTAQIVPVTFSEQALAVIQQHTDSRELSDCITQVLELDPRPGYQQRENPVSDEKSDGLSYGIEISGFEVKYTIKNKSLFVTTIYKID